MNFPKTRATLIQRLASSGDENDWNQFLSDYWGPLCGFATRWGRLAADDAEDVTAQVFVILWESQLFARWSASRTAKLRTLLCGVARRAISNRARVTAGRKEILTRLAQEFPDGTTTWKSEDVTQQDLDTFYEAWTQDIVRKSLDNLLLRCHREGQGDHFRVLYGRLCEGLPTRQIAEELGIEVTTAENYFKTCKARLKRELERAVANQMERYTDEANRAEQFAQEWNDLSDFLTRQGGLEQAVRDSYEQLGDEDWSTRRSGRFEETKSRLLQNNSCQDSP